MAKVNADVISKGLPLTSCIRLPHRHPCFDTCAVVWTFDSDDRHKSLQHTLSAGQTNPFRIDSPAKQSSNRQNSQ